MSQIVLIPRSLGFMDLSLQSCSHFGAVFFSEIDELVNSCHLSELAAMSDNLRTQALQISRLLHSFLQNAEVHSRRLPIGASMQKSQELLCILEHDFSLDSFRPARATPGLTVRQFQNRCAKLRSKCAKLQKELQLVKGEKLSGRVQKVWCLRTGLSPPNIAPQSLVWDRTRQGHFETVYHPSSRCIL